MTNASEEHTAEAGQSFADPEFETMQLGIEVDEATDAVHNAVKGLHGTPTAVGVKIRTTDGMLVAVVCEGGETDDDAASVLHYRTEPESDLATRKARKLAGALEQYVTEAGTVPSG